MYSCVLTILGVTIDDKLTFSEHIKDISKRASQKVGVLQRLRNLIPCSAKLQLYKSAILPHLTYALYGTSSANLPTSANFNEFKNVH